MSLSAKRKKISQNVPIEGRINGIITNVYLKNFMNHAELDLDLEPNVNVITGHNGAGKSSVLQAIVLALGGRAKDTKRASNMETFIRRDAASQTAEISVTLFNGNAKNDPYKSDDYGDRIVLCRSIYKSTSRHLVKDSQGRVLYRDTKAIEEKRAILNFFNIEIDNPTLILQQEEAKTFLSSNTDKHKLYDFFNRSTLLKPLKEQYTKAGEDVIVVKNSLKDKMSEKESSKVKIRDLENNLTQLKIVNQSHDLGFMAILIQAQEKTKKLRLELDASNEAETRLQRLQEDTNRHEETLGEKQQAGRTLELEFNLKEAHLRMAKEAENNARQECQERQDELNAHGVKIAQVEENRKRAKHMSDEVKTNIAKKNVELKKQERASSDDQLREHRKRMDELNEKVREKKREFESICNETGEIEDDLKKKKDDRVNFISELKRAQLDKARCEMEAGKNESEALLAEETYIDAFGDGFKGVMNELKRVRFQRMPIGPVARHMRLIDVAAKQEAVARLLDAVIHPNNLRSFIVFSAEDRAKLNSIFTKHFKPGLKPSIVLMPYRQHRIDISRGRAQTSDFKALVDLIEFEDPNVFNFIVEKSKIETILLMTDEDAQSVFADTSRVPKNAKRAVTTEFRTYAPATTRYSASYIKDSRRRTFMRAKNEKNSSFWEQESKNFERDLLDLRRKLSKNDVELKKLRDKLNGCNDAKNRLKHQYNNLINQTNQVKSAFSTLETLQEDVEREKASLEKWEQQIKSLSEEKVALLTKKNQLTEALERSIANVNEKEAVTTAKRSELADWEDASRRDDLQSECRDLAVKIAKNQDLMTAERRKIEPQLAELLETAKTEEERAQTEYEKRNIGGKEIMNLQTLKELDNLNRQKKKELIAKLGNADVDEVKERINDLKSEAKKVDDDLAVLEDQYAKIEKMNNMRKDNFVYIRKYASRNVKRIFALCLKKNDLPGYFDIDHKNQTLSIVINRSDNGDEANTDELSTLSGGEKSKVLASLILSLWDAQRAPFKALDEWDVYLDDSNRKQIERMLITEAKKSLSQYIFISPQDCTYDEGDLKIIRLEDPSKR